jgi:predicted anti-sigma-YlaC factor YlaD
MKKCATIKPLLSRYVDGDLLKTDLPGITAHLERCSGCRDTLKQYATMKAILSASYSEGALPRDFAHIMLDGKIAVRGRAFYQKSWKWAASTAIIGLALMTLFLLPHSRRQDLAGPAYILESNGRSIADLPLGSMIYYEHYAGTYVHSPFVRFSSNAAEEQDTRDAALSKSISYESPVFDDRAIISRWGKIEYE